MLATGKAALIRIYTNERATADGGPLYQEIVERARMMPVAGLTVLRGVVGFGASGKVQRASILDLSGNLPLVIELVDEETTLRAFWQRLEGLNDIGLVTLDEIEVLHYGDRRSNSSPGRRCPSALTRSEDSHDGLGMRVWLHGSDCLASALGSRSRWS